MTEELPIFVIIRDKLNRSQSVLLSSKTI